ncbi:acetyl-CoA acetyltransferase [Legionella londiniensis]|uniref:Acetyl-CoA acetyltransferase n=1 Tax=Legionella londiniensis TaxID=45068 RepID=A0A0W0VM90_9GAMM|nr:acetyl-CoA acetyltransferase [Legionella londiniensis]STX93265.1 acetyl-CoA acetyltransferase [Legionella londiniensis]
MNLYTGNENVNNDLIVITSLARTPIGHLLGYFKDLTAYELGAYAIKAAIERAHLKPDDIEEVFMGCILQAGLGQAPARQAAIAAGVPHHVGCSTINKMCGSGMKSIMLGFDAIMAGTHNVIVAGGMESMTNAPYLLTKARVGYRLGHGQLIDHMYLDGLEDAYERGTLMGVFADNTAKKFGFSRKSQDEYAKTSILRAQQATKEGRFNFEITPVTVTTAKEEKIYTTDEGPQAVLIEKIPLLKPAFSKYGTVTAANSSKISDGAAAMVLMRSSKAEALGIKPLAVIRAHASYAHEPGWFTTTPAAVIRRLIKKVDWTLDSVDLLEINEAFAVVPMVAMKELNIPHEKVNVHGGACVLGHPIGASGARIVATLIGALKYHEKKRGIAAICIGGGEATALAIEMMD